MRGSLRIARMLVGLISLLTRNNYRIFVMRREES